MSLTLSNSLPDWTGLLRPLGAGDQTPAIPDDLPYRDLLPARLREAAVLVPLRDGKDDLEVVFTRRNEQLRHHAGQISFPGGGVEQQDPSRLHAALRETEEEIGLPPAAVMPLGCLNSIVTITGYTVVPFVGLICEQAVLRPDPREVAEIFTVPLAYLSDPAHHQRQRGWFRGQEREFDVICYRDYRIWGATAAILVDLSDRIRGGNTVAAARQAES